MRHYYFVYTGGTYSNIGNGVLSFEREFEVVTAHREIIKSNGGKICVVTWWCEISEEQFNEFTDKYRDVLPDGDPVPEEPDATTH